MVGDGTLSCPSRTDKQHRTILHNKLLQEIPLAFCLHSVDDQLVHLGDKEDIH